MGREMAWPMVAERSVVNGLGREGEEGRRKGREEREGGGEETVSH